MIQDIIESFDNSFKPSAAHTDDPILAFDDSGRIMVRIEGKKIHFTRSDVLNVGKCVYLFSVGDIKYFLSAENYDTPVHGFAFKTVRELRDAAEGIELFVAFTAYHLWKWYNDNKFCGRCGHTLALQETERSLKCPVCSNVIYPRINPAVIVGVIRDDAILITRYRRGYAHNALVAGFTEIGETLEQTVEREVMEETGLRVSDIRYYKSQPWGMAQDILVGFFCRASGGELKIDEDELKTAFWAKPDELILQPNDLSLTNDMMKAFKNGLIQ